MMRWIGAMIVAVCALPALGDWAAVGARCEAVLARENDARYRELYYGFVYGLAGADERDAALRLAREQREAARGAIEAVDAELARGEAGPEADKWIRARAGTLAFAQARAAVLVLAAGGEDADRETLAGEVVRVINSAHARDGAQMVLKRSIPAAAALVLGECATAVELFTQALEAGLGAPDRADALAARGVEIAVGSAMGAACLAGGEQGGRVLDRVQADVGGARDGLGAWVVADARARLAKEAEGLDGAAGVYERLLASAGDAEARAALRARVLSRLADLSAGQSMDGRAVLVVLARAGALVREGACDRANELLDGASARRVRGDDLSDLLRLRAACAEGEAALAFLAEHVRALPGHPETARIGRAAAALGGELLRAGGGDVEGAMAFVRHVRDAHPEFDPEGSARAALAVRLAGGEPTSADLVEAAATWLSVRDRLGVRADANVVVCLVGALRGARGSDRARIAQELLRAVERGGDALGAEHGALAVAGRTLGLAAMDREMEAAGASGELVALDRLGREEDSVVVALALGERYRIVRGNLEAERKTLDAAARLCGGDARGIMEHALRVIGERYGSVDDLFLAGADDGVAHDLLVQQCDVLKAWADEHDPSLADWVGLVRARVLVTGGDGDAALGALASIRDSIETRWAGGEALLVRGDSVEAFGVYRGIVDGRTAAAQFDGYYFAAWVRMLEVLSGREDAGARRAEILGEVDRLLAMGEVGGCGSCAERLREIRRAIERM